MNVVLQIDVRQFCQMCELDGSFWKDVLIAVLGGIFGTGTALLVFYLTNRHQVKIDERKKAELQKNKLYYFASVLKSSIDVTKQQKANLKKFILDFKKDTLIIPRMSVTPMSDLESILRKMDLEDYFLSYTNEYGTGIDIVREYKSIIDNLEYLYSSFNVVVSQLESGTNFDHERKQRFQIDFQSASGFLHKLIPSIKKILIFPQISKILGEYTIYLKDPYNLKYHHDNFVVKLHDVIVPYVQNPGNLNAEELNEFVVMLKGLGSLYGQIESNNKILLQDYLKQVRAVAPQIKKLEKASESILNDFYTQKNRTIMEPLKRNSVKNLVTSNSFWSLIISASALILSYYSYDITRQQLNLSVAQVRAYVQVVDASLVESINDASFIRLKLTVRNFGETGAVNIESDMDYKLGMPGQGEPNTATLRNLGSLAPGMEKTFVLTANRINQRNWPGQSNRTFPLYFYGTVWYTDATTKERKKDDYCYELSFRPSDSTFVNLKLEQSINFTYTSK